MIDVYVLVSTIISLIFAVWIFERYVKDKKPKNLFWGVGLLFMTIAFLNMFYAQYYSWNVYLYKLYNYSSTILVLLLGLGTIYLFNNKKFIRYSLIYSILVIIIFTIVNFSASINAAILQSSTANAMPTYVTGIGMLLVIPGAIALIVGAFYSAYRLRHTKNAIVYNSLIGLGALVFSAVGSAALVNNYALYYSGQMIGVILMFLGFLKSIDII
jgi:hypothetical protein